MDSRPLRQFRTTAQKSTEFIPRVSATFNRPVVAASDSTNPEKLLLCRRINVNQLLAMNRFNKLTRLLLSFALCFAASAGAQTYVNFEGKLTRPICLSPDGTRLFAVNTPDARLSVFDVTHPLNPFLIAEIPVGVEPVSVLPRNNDEAWVVNEVSDSISVVSVSRKIVTDTIYVQDEPADVVFAGGAHVDRARAMGPGRQRAYAGAVGVVVSPVPVNTGSRPGDRSRIRTAGGRRRHLAL